MDGQTDTISPSLFLKKRGDKYLLFIITIVYVKNLFDLFFLDFRIVRLKLVNCAIFYILSQPYFLEITIIVHAFLKTKDIRSASLT